MRTQMWDRAQAAIDARECPRCGRPKGQRCRNLRSATWKQGFEVSFISLPHRDRYGDEQKAFD